MQSVTVLEAPPLDVASPEEKVAGASARKPRDLSTAIRKHLGLPAAKVPPYRFGFVTLLIALVGVPVLMLGWYKTMFFGSFLALVAVPAVRWYEKREIEKRDRVYTHGNEVVARVLDVEPGGPDRNGKVVRIEFVVTEPRTERIAASVFSCPFARKGLEPGDDVVVYYAPEEPQRCLIVERIARKSSAKARRMPPPKACGPGGCGNGACGAGGCGGGGCGTGGCC